MMSQYAGTELILEYIAKRGPQRIDQLCRSLNLIPQTAYLYLRQPLNDGVIVFEKVPKPGTKGGVRRYRFPHQPEHDPEQSFKEPQPKRKGRRQSQFSRFDPSDPFGLVARLRRGESISLPRSALAWRDEAT